jgi:2-aminoethylphosphonate-pyruvate transaminase
LTTDRRTRDAGGLDHGSWDDDFRRMTREVCAGLMSALGALNRDYCCVPMQGSGTFAVEAAVRTLVAPRAGLVVPVNGAYCERLATLARRAGRKVETIQFPWDQPIDPERLTATLAWLPADYTHVGIVHCETSTGMLNPLPQLATAAGVAGREVIVDAMSTFGALDTAADHPAISAIVAASGKCLESVPGVGFVFVAAEALEGTKGRADSLSLDLADQYEYLERTGQWRFTPPTTVVASLAEALRLYREQGGRPGRLARYQANNRELARGAHALGLKSYLDRRHQAPIIHTFHVPDLPGWDFDRFYQGVKRRGFILYPGKLTQADTFRVGCIGAIDPADIRRAVAAIKHSLDELGTALPDAARPAQQRPAGSPAPVWARPPAPGAASLTPQQTSDSPVSVSVQSHPGDAADPALRRNPDSPVPAPVSAPAQLRPGSAADPAPAATSGVPALVEAAA